MKIFNKTALASATAAALGFGIAGNAYAGAKAYAFLDVSDFQILKSDGTQFTAGPGGDFATLNISNQYNIAAQLNGAPPTSNSNSGPGDLHPAQVIQFLGLNPGIADNTFTQVGPHAVPPAPIPTPTFTFSRADADLTGAAVGGLPGITNNADALQVTEINLSGSNQNANTGNSSLGTNTLFTFTLASAGTITFAGIAQGSTYVAYDALAIPTLGNVAGASFNFTISITDGTGQVFSFAPNALSGASLLSQDTPGSKEYVLAPTALSLLGAVTTPTLLAGVQYTLNINSNTQVQAKVAEIPEIDAIAGTGALTLLGGALALVGERRRRMPKA